ncbi:MAG: hypothetical protein FWD87_11145 [Spirochaetaceae bacterium]|nr:hypothetical protein [Spirochaetaceae bacterium]
MPYFIYRRFLLVIKLIHYIYRLHAGNDQQNNQALLDMNFDIYLILLGFIFSVAWLLVVLGGKSWQENWKAHIDMLEDEVTGPLYKVIHCGKYRSYSVSRINIVLSAVVTFVWFCILISKIQTIICTNNLHLVLVVIGFLVALYFLIFWCRSSEYKGENREVEDSTTTNFILRKNKGAENNQ